jgi:dihydrolipoamide dehydrogenase
MRNVDVAIIGAGHAGLNALKEVRAAGASWVLIDGGPLGTTCAQVGCMPSKAVIELAQASGPRGAGREMLTTDVPGLLERVRDLRDTFIDLVLASSTDNMVEGRELLRGEARFLEPDLLEVGDERIRACRVVVATDSRPLIPGAYRTLGERLLTSESLFDLEHLPGSVSVIGLGAIGLEFGQALHRLGVTVTGFDAHQTVAGLTDSEVSAVAVGALEREFPIHLGAVADFSIDGSGVRVTAGNTTVTAERLLLAVGRMPSIPEGLSRHCRTDPRRVPEHDLETFRVGDLPVFIAGDATGARMLLQDTADEGRAAGANAVREEPRAYPRKTPMGIVFADPNTPWSAPSATRYPRQSLGSSASAPSVARSLWAATEA